MTTDMDEWRSAVAELTEMERAPYDEPEIYADTMSPDGDRL
jgi:hypothetical protein